MQSILPNVSSALKWAICSLVSLLNWEFYHFHEDLLHGEEKFKSLEYMHALGPDVCLGENHWSFATWQLHSLLFYIIFILQLIIRPLFHSLNRIQHGISQMHSSKPFLAPWLFLNYFISWIPLWLELYISRYQSQACKSETTNFPGFQSKPGCLWRCASMWVAAAFFARFKP